MQYRRRRLDVEITYYTYTYIIHRRKSIIRKWERTAKVLAVKKGGEGVGGRAHGCRFVVRNVYTRRSIIYMYVSRAINGRRPTESREIGLGAV